MWLRCVLVVLLCLVSTGCSGLRVSSDWDPAAVSAMQAWRSWAFMPGTPLRTGDVRLDNPLVDARVRAAVETVLARKGMVRADAEAADCLLAYQATVEAISEVRIDDYHGYRRGAWQATTVQYDEGTLVLDVIDGRTRQLAWRGSARGAVDPDATPAERSERAYEAVASILEGFPPTPP